MTTTMPTLPNHHQHQQRYDVARRISITCSNDNAAPSTPTRSHDSSSLFDSTNMPMLNRDNKIPICDWFIMHSRTDSESATCYYSPPTHLPLHPGYMIGGSGSTTAANTNICHEMNTGCSMFTDPIKKTCPTCTNNSSYSSDSSDMNMKSSEEDFILVSPSFPDLSLSSSTSLDDIDISGHGDDMDDDSIDIDMDMLSISSSSPPPPTTIRLAARPRSFSPSNSAFTPSVVPRVSPIKQLSTLLSSTELNTFTPIQVQDDNHDDTTTKTSFRKSPYLW